MSHAWRAVQLGELLEVQNGYAFDSKQFSTAGGVPLVRIRDLKNGRTTETNFVGPYDPKYEVHRGDLLVGMDGEFACYRWEGPTALLNQRVCRLHQFSEMLFPDFLLYGINKYLKDIEDRTTYTTVKHLSARAIREILLPLPPRAEQHRIVAVLNEAFARIDTAIANDKQSLANARQLFQTHLDSTFAREGSEWAEKALGDIAEIRGGKRVPNGYKLQKVRTPFPYISVSDFTLNGGVDSENVRFISDEVHSQIRRYTISAADIYLSIAGTIGKTGMVPDELDGANLTENACKIVVKAGVINRFVYYFTRTSLFAEQVAALTRTTAQPKLALSRIRTIRLPIPNECVQADVVEVLDRVGQRSRRLESVYERKLAALAELKQAILHKAFAGGLTAKAAEKEFAAA